MSDDHPVLDRTKPFASIYDTAPNQTVFFEQFGAQFGADDAFVGFVDNYDPKVHSEVALSAPEMEEQEVKTRDADGTVTKRKVAVKKAKKPPAPKRRTKRQIELAKMAEADREAADAVGVGD